MSDTTITSITDDPTTEDAEAVIVAGAAAGAASGAGGLLELADISSINNDVLRSHSFTK